jgi:hypothetical protein
MEGKEQLRDSDIETIEPEPGLTAPLDHVREEEKGAEPVAVAPGAKGNDDADAPAAAERMGSTDAVDGDTRDEPSMESSGTVDGRDATDPREGGDGDGTDDTDDTDSDDVDGTDAGDAGDDDTGGDDTSDDVDGTDTGDDTGGDDADDSDSEDAKTDQGGAGGGSS